MRYHHAVMTVLVSSALLFCSPAEASIFKKIGHAIGKSERAVGHAIGKSERAIGHATMSGVRAVGRGGAATVKFVDKKVRTPVGRAVMKYTGKGLDAVGNGLDHFGNLVQAAPIVGAAAPLVHDVSKALHSKTAHYAAAIGAGLAVGGGTLGPMAGAGTSSTALGRVAFAGGSSAMTGYYGRHVYLGIRCFNGHTKTCDRLQAKP